MTGDAKLRELQRRWQETGAPEDREAYLRECIRRETLPDEVVELMRRRLFGAEMTARHFGALLDDEGGSPFESFMSRLNETLAAGNGASSQATSIRLADYFEPIADEDLPEELRETGKKWRKMAQAWGYNGFIAWRVRAGFTLKQHAPRTGNCQENFEYLQDWDFEDEPTQDVIVFWIPRLVPNSRSKNVGQQQEILNQLRAEYDLPEHHLNSFGGAALLAGLILRHFELADERVPLNRWWARTDTVLSRGARLFLGFFSESGLHCYDWFRLGNGYDDLGCFAWGAELGI